MRWLELACQAFKLGRIVEGAWDKHPKLDAAFDNIANELWSYGGVSATVEHHHKVACLGWFGVVAKSLVALGGKTKEQRWKRNRASLGIAGSDLGKMRKRKNRRASIEA